MVVQEAMVVPEVQELPGKMVVQEAMVVTEVLEE